jgi:transposase
MGAPYSLDLRERVVAAVAGGMGRAEAARRFKVSRCSAIRRADVAWTATVSVRTSQRQAAPSASTAHR